MVIDGFAASEAPPRGAALLLQVFATAKELGAQGWRFEMKAAMLVRGGGACWASLVHLLLQLHLPQPAFVKLLTTTKPA